MERFEDNKQLVIFDFCGTFIDFQTADEYIKWLLSRDSKKIRQKITFFKLKLIEIFGIEKHYFKKGVLIRKKVLAKGIKGISLEEAKSSAQEYVENVLLCHTINETISIYNKYKSEGKFLALISAAYDIYLQEFIKRYPFDLVISTRLESKNGKMTGKIVDECVGKSKVEKAINYFNNIFGDGNYRIVASISDSVSDIPILDIADRKIIMSPNGVMPKWIKPNYEVINYEDIRQN